MHFMSDEDIGESMFLTKGQGQGQALQLTDGPGCCCNNSHSTVCPQGSVLSLPKKPRGASSRDAQPTLVENG